MEKLTSRLEEYAIVLDVLDGVKAYPNAQEDYDVILGIVRRIHEEIANVRGRLEESKQLMMRQRAQARALDALTDRIKHLIDNAHFYAPFVSTEDDGGMVSPAPSHSWAHSSPIQSPFFPELVQNTTRNNSNLQPPEARFQPLPPKTPKPKCDLVVAISYISNEDFAKVPAYMKGRIRFEEINSFVTTFNSVLNQKVALLNKPKKSLKLKTEMDLVIEWKAQTGPTLSGQYFLSAKDFSSLANYKFSKKDFSIITILRHVQRIKETRVGKTVFYVACF